MADDDPLAEVVSEMRDELTELREENRRLREEGNAEETKPPAPPNDEIIESFFDYKSYAKATERPNRHAINYFRQHIGDEPFRDATKDDVLDFANNWSGESKPPKRSTMLSYLGTVKVLYDWMSRQEWGPDDNVVEVGRERYKSENRSHINRSGKNSGTVIKPEEYLQLVRSNMTDRDKSLLVLAVKTGLRRKELARLTVQDLDLEAKRVYNRYPKGVGEDPLPRGDADEKLIDDETVAVMKDWLSRRERMLELLADRGHEGRRGDGAKPDTDWLYPNDAGEMLTPMTISRWWGKATNKAMNRVKDDDPGLAEKFDDFTPHDARRCFTTWLNTNGCSREIVLALRGDAAKDMVDLYTQVGEEEVRRQYEKAMPKLGIQ